MGEAAASPAFLDRICPSDIRKCPPGEGRSADARRVVVGRSSEVWASPGHCRGPSVRRVLAIVLAAAIAGACGGALIGYGLHGPRAKPPPKLEGVRRDSTRRVVAAPGDAPA